MEVTLELGKRGWKIFEQRKYKLIYFLEQTVSRNIGANDAAVLVVQSLCHVGLGDA